MVNNHLKSPTSKVQLTSHECWSFVTFPCSIYLHWKYNWLNYWSGYLYYHIVNHWNFHHIDWCRHRNWHLRKNYHCLSNWRSPPWWYKIVPIITISFGYNSLCYHDYVQPYFWTIFNLKFLGWSAHRPKWWPSNYRDRVLKDVKAALKGLF